jgi:hypothetical protein
MDLMTVFKEKQLIRQRNEDMAKLAHEKRMVFEERAGIMEYDGELERAEVEGGALEIVLKCSKRGDYKDAEREMEEYEIIVENTDTWKELCSLIEKFGNVITSLS